MQSTEWQQVCPKGGVAEDGKSKITYRGVQFLDPLTRWKAGPGCYVWRQAGQGKRVVAGVAFVRSACMHW
jgi:hypothetical protein